MTPPDPSNRFPWETARSAHLVAEELRKAWHGGYGVSWEMLVDAFDDRVFPERCAHAALGHVRRMYGEQGFVIDRECDGYAEYRLRYVGDRKGVGV